MPRLLFGKSTTLAPVVGDLSTSQVKKYGTGLHNLVTLAADTYTGSLCTRYDLIGTVMGKREFSTTNNLWAVKEERREVKKDQDDVNDAKLRVIVNGQGDFEKHLLLRSKHTGSWLNIRGTTVIGIVLAAKEFRDF